MYTNLARKDRIPTTVVFEGTVEAATYRNPPQNNPYIASDEYEGDLRILVYRS